MRISNCKVCGQSCCCLRGASKTIEGFLNNLHNCRPIVFVFFTRLHVIMVCCQYSCKILFVQSYCWFVRSHRQTRGVCYHGAHRKISVIMLLNIKYFKNMPYPNLTYSQRYNDTFRRHSEKMT